MMHLPKIPYKMQKNQSQVVSMRGINFSNMISDGDMADSKNISARSYPYITTRKARAQVGDYAGVTAMTVFRGKFVVVQGTDLLYDGVSVGKVTPGEKQFAAINTKLVIMPDKKYLDGETLSLCDMGVSQFVNADIGTNSIKVNVGYATFASGRNCTAEGNKLLVPPLTYLVKKTDDVLVRLDEITRYGDDVYVYFQVDLGIDSCIYITECKESIVGGYSCRSYIILDADEKSKFEVGDTLYLFISMISPSGYTYDDRERSYDTLQIDEISVKGRSLYLYGKHFSSPHYQESRKTIYNGLYRDAKVEFDSVKDRGYISFDVRYENGESESEVKLYEHRYFKPSYSRVEDNLYKTDVHNGGNQTDLINTFSSGDTVIIKNGSASQKLTVKAVAEDYIEFEEDITLKVDPYEKTEIQKSSNISGFKVGDAITISGSKSNDMTFIVHDITDGTISAENDIFTESSESENITIERKIPELDFICESDNRIWGCSNADNTIYASALGDPTNFFDYSGESTDSYAVGVGSEEKFTACCRYNGGVLFFKEMKLHKILGSYPAEYALYSYDIEGVQNGCHKSLQIINEVLYYKGVHGVFAFNGSPRLISSNFGEKDFGRAVAGNDGDTYYISMSDGVRDYLFAYETKYGIWVLEDDVKVSDFARIGRDTYMLCEDGKFYLCGSGESETGIEWLIQFAPLYETIEGKKSYSRIVFRLELPQGSYMIVDVRTDSGAWREAGKVVGKKDGIVPVTVPINRCDKFEIRLRGKGKCTIHQMKREFYVGGER